MGITYYLKELTATTSGARESAPNDLSSFALYLIDFINSNSHLPYFWRMYTGVAFLVRDVPVSNSLNLT
jgi:hypothetical protein